MAENSFERSPGQDASSDGLSHAANAADTLRAAGSVTGPGPGGSQVVVPIAGAARSGERRGPVRSWPWVTVLVFAYPLLWLLIRAATGAGFSPLGLVLEVLIVAALAATVIRPVLLIHATGTVVFSRDGMRVRFPGLLTDDWVVPADRIASVEVSPVPVPDPPPVVLGLSAAGADVVVHFTRTPPPMPVRLGFLPVALIAMWRHEKGVPAPQAAPMSVCWRSGGVSAQLERQVIAVLGGGVVAAPTYRAAASSPGSSPANAEPGIAPSRTADRSPDWRGRRIP